MKRAMGFFGSLAVCSVWLACSPQGTAPESEVGSGSSAPALRESASGLADDRRKMRFLGQLREADPQFQTIERAVMNEQNELGLILSRNVAMDEIPRLMRAVLKQMAAQYPGEDLTVIAYAPSEPPMKIGTGRLDAATREMTYTPARR